MSVRRSDDCFSRCLLTVKQSFDLAEPTTVVRVRVRGGVIRVRISDTRVRIRIVVRATEHPACGIFYLFHISISFPVRGWPYGHHVLRCRFKLALVLNLTEEAEPTTVARVRDRGGDMRARISDTRVRIRIAARATEHPASTAISGLISGIAHSVCGFSCIG